MDNKKEPHTCEAQKEDFKYTLVHDSPSGYRVTGTDPCDDCHYKDVWMNIDDDVLALCFSSFAVGFALCTVIYSLLK